MILYICIAGILGLLFGSLSTVLTERWHTGKGGILFGRSACPHCSHELSASELIPLFSYIFQGGKCRHCHTKISITYPLSEIFMSMIFMMLSYKAWLFGYTFLGIEHIFLLILGFVTGVYMIYDIRYMEIPDQIMIPAIWMILLVSGYAWYDENFGSIFFDMTSYEGYTREMILDHIRGGLFLYTFLYIQILLPGGYYLLKMKKIREFFELLGSYIFFPFILLFGTIFQKNITNDNESTEIPTWIGGGDLRIALFIGLTLGTLHGIASFFFAYILGSIVGIIILMFRYKTKNTNHQIPFGPFLGIGWFISILFHEEIISKYISFFI